MRVRPVHVSSGAQTPVLELRVAAAVARTIRSMSTQSSALARSLQTAHGLRPGTWEAVEALSILAMEARGLPDGSQLLAAAQATASRLKSGSWEAVRALAWLSRAERELADGATASTS